MAILEKLAGPRVRGPLRVEPFDGAEERPGDEEAEELEGLDPLDHETRHLRGLVRRDRGEAREPLGRIRGPHAVAAAHHRRPQPLLGRLAGRAKRPHLAVAAQAGLEVRPAVVRDPHRLGQVVASEGLPLRMAGDRGNRERRALLAAVRPQAVQDPGEQHPA